MKTIEIELSDSASAVIAEMARRGKVKPEALARICVEDTLSSTIDRVMNDGDADVWFMENARDPNKACRECWEEVEFAGNYATALGRKGMSEPVNPDAFMVELKNGYAQWNLNEKFRQILEPVAEKFGVSVEEFLQLYSRDELSNPKREQPLAQSKIPAGFSVTTGNTFDVSARIERAAKFSEQTVEEWVWNTVASSVDSCEGDMLFSPATSEPIGDVCKCRFYRFSMDSHQTPVVA